MLYYDRVDLGEEIDVAKSTNSKEYMICYCWFFKHGFKFQDSACNGFHDLMMLSLNIRGIAVIAVKEVDYHCTIHGISKFEAIHLLENSLLDDRGYI